MIEKLSIKNFAIIDDMTIDFKSGFTVIVGETGAGKSIIVEAINLILGSRANNSMIKEGCDKSYLTGIFSLTKDIEVYLSSNDIFYDDKLEIVRVLNVNGKSSYKVNGQTVNLTMISKIRDMLIEIKRQTDNEISSDDFYAVKLIDRYADIHTKECYRQYLTYYNEYKQVCEKLENLLQIESSVDIDYVKMQIRRIEELNIYENELEDLIEKSNLINNYLKISNLISKVKGDLDTLYSTSGSINKSVRDLQSLGVKFDTSYEEINILIEDFVNSFCVDFTDVNDSEIEFIEERIFLIKKLYKLYGDYSGICNALNDLNSQLYEYENSAILIDEYRLKKEKLECLLDDECQVINKYRANKGQELCDYVKNVFADLYMDDASIKFDYQSSDYTRYGNVDVRLLISTNNNAFWPINKIASGGERARVILAIKNVIASNSDIATIVFDEVDTGVSGRVASAMGKLMKKISSGTQVISITHLAQVAVVADHFISVEKSKEDEEFVSSVSYVTKKQKEYVVAKLLSGDKVTNEALLNAKSLIQDEV